MFTGIIQDIGTVTGIVKESDWRFSIQTKLSLENTPLGASIACSGTCLTVTAKNKDSFDVQASAETLNVTTLKNWKVGTNVNLEPALRLGDELGGHLVAGHVDGVIRLVEKKPENASIRLTFSVPDHLSRYLAPKGSAVIDGVSLTVNEVEGSRFGVNIIPFTQKATTLGKLEKGDDVNFEADMIARYLERLLNKP